MNIFENPNNVILSLREDFKVKDSQTLSFKGKALACIFLTRFCPVNCEFCFFNSMHQSGKKTTQDAFSDEGIDKFIDFANSANLGYLLVSGGGDPFVEYKKIIKIIKNVNVDKIVLVTSGFWATHKHAAYRKLQELTELSKETQKEIVLRLSYDEFHLKTLKSDIIYNILDYFKEHDTNLKFKVHTMLEDREISKFLDNIKNDIDTKKTETLNSDSDILYKINPKEDFITLKDGVQFRIGYAKRFYPDSKVDLTNEDIINRNASVFLKDMKSSEEYNSSIVRNKDGSYGLDFWLNYNGNISTWGNQVPNNIFNVYHHNYEDMVLGTMSDPLSYAYLDRSVKYLENIISEVNSHAVVRANAINIRDYASAIRLEEDKTRLYATIRIMQDYLENDKLDSSCLSEDSAAILSISKTDLKELHNNSNYDIISQYFMGDDLDKDKINLLLELVDKGHYDLSENRKEELIKIYNSLYGTEIQYLKEVYSTKVIIHDERLIPLFKNETRDENIYSTDS